MQIIKRFCAENVKEVGATMWWTNHFYRVFVKHDYNFFRETVCFWYLLHLSSVYRIKCLEEIYKQQFCFEDICTYSFDDSMHIVLPRGLLHVLFRWFNAFVLPRGLLHVLFRWFNAYSFTTRTFARTLSMIQCI